LHLG